MVFLSLYVVKNTFVLIQKIAYRLYFYKLIISDINFSMIPLLEGPIL